MTITIKGDAKFMSNGVDITQKIKDDPSFFDKDKCQHEPEMNFGKDSRPRYIKAKEPACRKCGEFYR